jgi:glycerol-3-phosphate dehydrogenase subunit C
VTTTYDPFHPKYFDEADLREEMDRVYDLCHGCRLCVKYCTSFPTLFDYIDRFDDQDSKKMTPAEQDQVVDECFGCKLCYINCPYIPGQHEWELDFPRLMLRAQQIRVRNGEISTKAKIQNRALASTDLAGKVNTTLSPIANKAIGTPGSFSRKVMEKTVGIAAERLLPPYARQRFSTWFRKRTTTEPRTVAAEQGTVALFPTCLVEYQEPAVGKDLVKVYERNGVSCSLPAGLECCGAPWLHSGNVDQFVKQAKKNIAVLADEVRAGRDVVVPQPTCGYAIRKDYVDYVGGDDAALVAANTYDAAEYLWNKVHKGEGTELDKEFTGEVPGSVTYHAPCHLRAQQVGLKGRDLIKLTGAKVNLVAECSAIDGTWGYREQNYEISRKVARKMADAIERADDPVVAGECALANGGILQETGKGAVHPLQVLARAYGIPEEER